MKQKLLALLRANPFLSQQELAAQLGLSRSAVAGHLAALTRERRILGRAYVLPGEQAIVCIGGINIDRKLRTLEPLQLGTSNPASLSETPGGVARNVAENLARLGQPVQLLSAVGDDAAGRNLLAQAEACGIRTEGCLRVAGAHTGSYTAVLDAQGELALALAHMDLCERLDPAFLRQCAPQRAQARLTLIDLNLPAASVAQLLQDAQAPGAAPLVAVAVSQPKMDRLPQALTGLDLLILNRAELETACGGTRLRSAAALQRAWQQLQQRGLKRLIVTDGEQGLWYSDSREQLQALPATPVQVLDVTGAGDAFAAGVCAALVQDADDLAAACRLGQRLAALTLQTDATVHPELSPALLDAPHLPLA
ncbi:carbohydrate kinase [Paucibacter sp. APW11]|uniref:Carbohydrate kinase n=1 Tax=Roseateles aquae TaxID=3077235 RepID=A0ABU3PBK2_9BURK|nr:carbohydrate kinase [Paucibacter sp. APW11]MDT8999946.1 carbohydrate kinase [Paucibacter sp. APW11]